MGHPVEMGWSAAPWVFKSSLWTEPPSPIDTHAGRCCPKSGRGLEQVSTQLMCHCHGVVYLTGKTQVSSRLCWVDAGLSGMHQPLAGPGHQALLKKMFISNLCWKQWGRKRKRQARVRHTDGFQGTIPFTSNVKGGCKTLLGTRCVSSSGQGAAKKLVKRVTRVCPPRWKSREGMRQDRFCQSLKRTSTLIPFHGIWLTAASKVTPGAFNKRCKSSAAKQSCRSHAS